MTPRLRTTTNLARVIIRPLSMSKSKWTQLVHQVSLDVASDEIVCITDDLTTINNLGLVGAVELLMRLGVLFSVLNIPESDES